MSNKLYSMLELKKMGFPHNNFYAIDPEGVSPENINSLLTDGLRNFRAKCKTRSVSIRTGMAGHPEVKLYLAPNLDADNDELIINKMKEALSDLSRKFNGYKDSFLIIQEWTPEDEYIYSLNLMPLNNTFLIEAGKGNHSMIGREKIKPSIIRLTNEQQELIHNELLPDDLLMLNRLLKQLFNKYLFEEKNIYEFSFINNGVTFYQIKKPGELLKNPISKKEFYEKLKKNNIPHQDRILRRN